MFTSLFYTIGKKTITIGGEVFPLGAMTAEVLNIYEDFREMRRLLNCAEAEMTGFLKTNDPERWQTAEEHYLTLRALLRKTTLFRLIDQSSEILEETQQYLAASRCEQRKAEPDGSDSTILLVAEYLSTVANDKTILDDIAAFNKTIHNFINYYLSGLEKLNPSNYAAALHDFIDDNDITSFIAGPDYGTGFYSCADEVTLRFIPQEDETGIFQIVEHYEATQLQTFLKMDFYRALGAGHIIRRCEYCKRYFLLTKAYHTKYCDLPNPDDPKHTCRQLGYRKTGRKEEAKDDPMANALRRCYDRLNQDVRRGRLTSKQRDTLYQKAQELHFRARKDPDTSNDAFEISVATETLCKLCGIQRKGGKPGRPKKNK